MPRQTPPSSPVARYEQNRPAHPGRHEPPTGMTPAPGGVNRPFAIGPVAPVAPGPHHWQPAPLGRTSSASEDGAADYLSILRAIAEPSPCSSHAAGQELLQTRKSPARPIGTPIPVPGRIGNRGFPVCRPNRESGIPSRRAPFPGKKPHHETNLQAVQVFWPGLRFCKCPD